MALVAKRTKPASSPSLLSLDPLTSEHSEDDDPPLLDLSSPSSSTPATLLPPLPHPYYTPTTPIVFGPSCTGLEGPYARLGYYKTSCLSPFHRLFEVGLSASFSGDTYTSLGGWWWIEVDLRHLEGDQILQLKKEIGRKTAGLSPRLACEKASWVVRDAMVVYVWQASAPHLP